MPSRSYICSACHHSNALPASDRATVVTVPTIRIRSCQRCGARGPVIVLPGGKKPKRCMRCRAAPVTVQRMQVPRGDFVADGDVVEFLCEGCACPAESVSVLVK